ncbi:MAG: hypothetical protein AAB250_12235 [Bdellovibrionota bacterium]
MSRVFIALAVLGLSSVSFAQSDQKATAFVLCKNKKDVRTIRVNSDSKKENCTTTYSKGGVDEVVGMNRNVQACRSILDSVRSNLENSNYNCRDVSSATTTTSPEVSRQ